MNKEQKHSKLKKTHCFKKQEVNTISNAVYRKQVKLFPDLLMYKIYTQSCSVGFHLTDIILHTQTTLVLKWSVKQCDPPWTY